MNKINSNPYVYPYVPFSDLSNKNFMAEFSKSKKVNLKDIAKLLKRLPRLEPEPKGKSVEEKILNIFLHRDVIFGPKKHILLAKSKWIESIIFFTKKNETIQFSILGFPFKIPVPLKTNRTTPDMGEVLMLKRLYEISQLIENIYKKGCKITIFAEGVFGRYNRQSDKEYKRYFILLRKLNASLGYDKFISIRELEEMEKSVNNFEKIFTAKTKKYKKLISEKDPEMLVKFNEAKESLKRIVNTKIYNLKKEELMDIYNPKVSTNELSNKLKSIRKEIESSIHELAINYFAYLKVRDDINFLHKQIPNVLTLSVSPKPGRLGVLPIDKNCVRLAYHGVPVYHPDRNVFTIEYLVDLERMKARFEKNFLKNFPESDIPFYYTKKS